MSQCFQSGADIRSYRKANQMNQTEFWQRIGLTQSAGSRYENDRDIPEPVRMLLILAYGNSVQADMMFYELRDWRRSYRHAA